MKGVDDRRGRAYGNGKIVRLAGRPTGGRGGRAGGLVLSITSQFSEM